MVEEPDLEGPRIEWFDGMTVVGLHRITSSSGPGVRELWQAFRPRVAEVGHRTSADFISMRIHVDGGGASPTPDSRFQQWAAVEVGDPTGIPEGMTAHRVRKGRYAVFTYRGRAADFGAAARYIYGEWLPRSGYALADREFFEVLGPSYRPDDPEATEEIWIPIQGPESP